MMLLSKLGVIFFISLLFFYQNDLNSVHSNETEQNLGVGSQPEIAIDEKGTIRIVYGVRNGKEKDLYYVVSSDGGKSYSKPFLLGNFDQMGLGMGRGPQITASKDYTVVTVGDHHGNLFALNLSKTTNRWSAPIKVNDADTTAREALAGLGAGKNNDVYAAWLDSRLGNNNLYGAFSADGGSTWSKNQLIYKGEPQGICDCCKPSVCFDQNGEINVMFRNKLSGARNMYLITSKDKGKHFGQARKLGTGNYMIDACPMDGGDLSADADGKITTVWRREMDVYAAAPGSPELKLGTGRTPVTLLTPEGVAIAWEKDRAIQFRSADGLKINALANGQYPKLALLKKQKLAVCVFERDGNVMVKTIAL